MRVHRCLYYRRTFWGFKKLKGGGWRLGFGGGFFEWGNGTLQGIWLPQRNLTIPLEVNIK